MGLSRPSSPGKCTATSPLKLLWLSDAHRLQAIVPSEVLVSPNILRRPAGGDVTTIAAVTVHEGSDARCVPGETENEVAEYKGLT
jgi:hypothetical protein